MSGHKDTVKEECKEEEQNKCYERATVLGCFSVGLLQVVKLSTAILVFNHGCNVIVLILFGEVERQLLTIVLRIWTWLTLILRLTPLIRSFLTTLPFPERTAKCKGVKP